MEEIDTNRAFLKSYSHMIEVLIPDLGVFRTHFWDITRFQFNK